MLAGLEPVQFIADSVKYEIGTKSPDLVPKQAVPVHRGRASGDQGSGIRVTVQGCITMQGSVCSKRPDLPR
jgi:hypothetical protein